MRILREERSRKLLRFERKYVVISRRDACSHSFASRSFAFLESLQTTITENFNCAKFGCTPTIALVCMIRKYDFVTDRSWSYSGISRVHWHGNARSVVTYTQKAFEPYACLFCCFSHALLTYEPKNTSRRLPIQVGLNELRFPPFPAAVESRLSSSSPSSPSSNCVSTSLNIQAVKIWKSFQNVP